MRLFLLPYKTGSKSAKALADTMGIKRCSHNRTSPNKTQRTIINWGHSGNDLSEYVLSNAQQVYNPPSLVAIAINKLHCLEALSVAGVSIPPFTTDINEARAWIRDSSKEVVERHMLRSSGGEGIRIRTEASSLQPAPLYTQYVKKKQEYRVHVIAGQVADVQRKAKRTGATIYDWKIRNLEAGFIFVRGEVSPPQDVIDQALLAIQAVALDFGAVDVIYNAHEEKAYVLEVNTACGLEGTTLGMYADGLKSMIEDNPIKPWSHWQEAVVIGSDRVVDYQEGSAPTRQSTAQYDANRPDARPTPRMTLQQLAGVRQTLIRNNLTQEEIDTEMRRVYEANGYRFASRNIGLGGAAVPTITGRSEEEMRELYGNPTTTIDDVLRQMPLHNLDDPAPESSDEPVSNGGDSTWSW